MPPHTHSRTETREGPGKPKYIYTNERDWHCAVPRTGPSTSRAHCMMADGVAAGVTEGVSVSVTDGVTAGVTEGVNGGVTTPEA